MEFRRITVFLLVLLMAGAAAFAEEPVKNSSKVEYVAFSRDAHSFLTISFGVTGLLDDRLKKSLDSGLPVRFTYTIRLIRMDKALWEGDSVFLTFERVLEKDNLRNLYILQNGEEKESFESVEEALLAMSKVENQPVCETEKLGRDSKYRAEVQVKFEEFRLPFFLHRFLPFVSLGDLKTPWRKENVPPELYR